MGYQSSGFGVWRLRFGVSVLGSGVMGAWFAVQDSWKGWSGGRSKIEIALNPVCECSVINLTFKNLLSLNPKP